MKDAEKVDWAQKKAARRAAFIEEIAETVALAVCGPARKRSPFAQAYHEQDVATWRAEDVREEEENGLRWAIKQGILPAYATELPSDEVQQYLLDVFRLTTA